MKISRLFLTVAGAWTLACASSVAASSDIVPYLGVMSRAVDPLIDTTMREDGLALSFMRGGDAHEAALRLGEIDAGDPGFGPTWRPRPWSSLPGATRPDLHRNWQEAFESLRRQMEEMDRRMGDLREGLPQGDPQGIPDARREGTRITSRQRVHVITQADGTQLRIEERNGERHLKVTDAEGAVLFDGPVNTAAEIEAIPEAFRNLIDQPPAARPRPRLIPRDVL